MGRRWPYGIYFMVMCLLYLLMVFVFHEQLQFEIIQSQKLKGIIRHVHSTVLELNESIKLTNGLQKDLSLIRSDLETMTESIADVSNCFMSPETTEYHFKVVKESIFYVYSAYYDNRDGKPVIRIISVLARKQKKKVKVLYKYGDTNSTDFYEGVMYEMCENHNKKFGGYLVSCPVNSSLTSICNIKIKITGAGFNDSSEVSLNITNISDNSAHHDYGVCVPPLFGNIDKRRIIEFVELYKLFGAKYFIFYDFHINNTATKSVLKQYENDGTVAIIPWVLPEAITDKSIWYHGQLLAHNDCLYRSMSLMKTVALQDIDEFIVPHEGGSTWQGALSKLIHDNVIGLSFHSSFYEPEGQNASELITMHDFRRTKKFSKVRTKVLVRPTQVFEVGIHHVSKPIKEGLQIVTVDTQIAYLHHYRTCVKNYGMNCKEFQIDRTMLRYYDDLKANFNFVMALHSLS